MDPTACLRELIRGLLAVEMELKSGGKPTSARILDERENVLQCLLDLQNWIKEGGFLPSAVNVYDSQEP